MGICGSTETGQPPLPGLNVANAGSNSVARPSPSFITFKVVLLGNKAVGKSSLVLRYTQDEFVENHNLTIGAAFVSKDIKFKVPSTNETHSVRLHIWDTAGEETFRSMTRFFFRDACAGLIVFDLTDLNSFEQASATWMADFEAQCPDTPMILVGNKCDLAARRNVSKEAMESLVASKNSAAKCERLKTAECSARLGQGVSSLFEDTAIRLLRGHLKLGSSVNIEVTTQERSF